MASGNILQRKNIKPISVNVNVSWEWHNLANGIVKWTFTNVSNNFISGLLFRDSYPFGNAFWPIYEENPEFDTHFTTVNTALVDQGIENNSPPLVIYKNPDKSLFVAFLFSLDGGQQWSMLEGGFTGGMTPSSVGVPEFIPATKIGIKTYSILWDANQCQGYNEQSGSDLPCPANPLQIVSSVFSLNTNVKPLFHDTFSSSLTCMQIAEDGIITENYEDIAHSVICALNDLNEKVEKLESGGL